MEHQTSVLMLVILLLTSGALATDPPCSSSFPLLEADLLSQPQNRFLLSTKFFPPRDANPVIIKVDYVYEDSNMTNVWFWSESEFYFIQPLEIFLYTSLFFANQPYRQSSLTLELSPDCLDAKELYMRVLTQRVSSCNYLIEYEPLENSIFSFSLPSMPSLLSHLPLLVVRALVKITSP